MLAPRRQLPQPQTESLSSTNNQTSALPVHYSWLATLPASDCCRRSPSFPGPNTAVRVLPCASAAGSTLPLCERACVSPHVTTGKRWSIFAHPPGRTGAADSDNGSTMAVALKSNSPVISRCAVLDMVTCTERCPLAPDARRMDCGLGGSASRDCWWHESCVRDACPS